MPDLVETPDNETSIQAAQILNKNMDDHPLAKQGKEKDSDVSPEVR